MSIVRVLDQLDEEAIVVLRGRLHGEPLDARSDVIIERVRAKRHLDRAVRLRHDRIAWSDHLVHCHRRMKDDRAIAFNEHPSPGSRSDGTGGTGLSVGTITRAEATA